MDAFGDGNFEQTEVDPAAEFLAREQNALAGLEDEIPPVVAGNGDAASDDVTQARSDDGNDDFSGYTVPKQVTEEPEKIRKWREDQKTRLEEKDREEERKREELREQARKELEDWYKHHEEAISKTKSANRESAKNAEKQFVAETDEIEPGTEWERIAKLCDFNPKTNKSSKDISRMRSIILQLKQNPLATSKKV
ncbi:clathrin light chain isoform X4 [Culex quinquefasciatus]|uniref:clathrin light chain isoform X4 n=1 Tax=Culex quinquefasciatus TaxID=7176 RepID=UPI0018E2E4EB|nr:clathrin light chain isoform X4 [Culex quinquefasciatus]